MRASLSGVYPAGGLRWRFAWGFDFGHGLSLPFVAAFAVLRGLLGVLVGAMGPFWPGMALSGLWGWGGGGGGGPVGCVQNHELGTFAHLAFRVLSYW